MSPPSHRVPELTAGQEQLLDEQLDCLRNATANKAAPAFLEAQLLSAFKSHHDQLRARRRRGAFFAQWFAPGFALAVSVGMSAWMVLAPMARTAVEPVNSLTAANIGLSADTPFIALQSLEQIALEPQPRLIETTVPRMWLASYGVSVSPELAADTLHAEMLVSANGQPLAMRFLP